MDAKFQKRVSRLGGAAWGVMCWFVYIWIFKWSVDLYINGISWIKNLGFSNSASLLQELAKVPSGQLISLDFYASSSTSFGVWPGLMTLIKLSWTSRLLCFFFDGITIVILIFGTWFFTRLMTEFRKGDIFSAAAIGYLNKLAKVAFWLALYLPINRMILGLILFDHGGPVGWLLFFPPLNIGDFLIIAISWFFIILTSLMYESRQLQEDRNLTV